MRERVEALIGDDCRRRLALDVPRAVRAAAAARGAEDRAVARLRHLRLVRSGRGRQAGAARARHRRQARAAAAGAVADQPGEEPHGRARVAARQLEPPRRADRQDLRALRHRADATATRSTSTTCCSRRSSCSRRRERSRELLRAASSSYVMVDEYQDTNRPQYLLIQPPRRGAPQPRASSATPTSRSTSGAAPTCATSSTSSTTSPKRTIVRLEQNYRSTQVILDAASAVISQNRNRKDKRLWTERKGGDRDRLLPRQRRARRGRLHRPHGHAGALREDVDATVAVLYRTNAQSRAIEDALMREGIALQDHRRRPVLRAQGNQGRARLPEADHQPARRRQPPAGDQRAGARHRQGRDGLAGGDRSRRGRRPTRRRCSRPASRRSRRRARSGRKLVYAVDERQARRRARSRR